MTAEGNSFKREMLATLPSLRAFAVSLTGKHDKADDLVQDTVMKAWAKQSSFEMGTNIKAWLFTIVTATVTMLQVRDYYLTHLPHFDSVGAYMYAFNVMNTTVTKGRLPGLILAAQSNLGWLEPFYAIPFSWLPNRSPAILVSLNFVLLALTQLAMADWLRMNEYSRRHQLVILLLPFLPGAFYAWDGGFQDWRRDAQLNILLIGDLFLSLAYVQRPTPIRGGCSPRFPHWARCAARRHRRRCRTLWKGAKAHLRPWSRIARRPMKTSRCLRSKA